MNKTRKIHLIKNILNRKLLSKNFALIIFLLTMHVYQSLSPKLKYSVVFTFTI